jgi:hypothetical protein
MKRRILSLALATAAILTGCILTSVHPFYTSKDVFFEPSLVGQWTNTEQSNERWIFEKEGQQAFTLTLPSDDGTNLVQAHLFKLDGQMFLDLAGLDQEWKMLPPPIPSHFLLKITQLTPTLRMVPLNYEWLKTLLEKDPKALHHELIKEPKSDDIRLVLTGETEEMQAFLIKNVKTEDAWKDGLELKRADASPDKQR